MTEWKQAAGSAGFNVGNATVYGAYVNRVALFAFESGLSAPESPFYTCVITGHCSGGGKTLEEAQAYGVAFAQRDGVLGADRVLSKREFEEIMDNPERLFPHSDARARPRP